MDHGFDWLTRSIRIGKEPIEQGGIAYITFHQLQSTVGDLSNSVKSYRRTIGQIVEYHKVMTCFKQYQAGMAADKAGASGDK